MTRPPPLSPLPGAPPPPPHPLHSISCRLPPIPEEPDDASSERGDEHDDARMTIYHYASMPCLRREALHENDHEHEQHQCDDHDGTSVTHVRRWVLDDGRGGREREREIRSVELPARRRREGSDGGDDRGPVDLGRMEGGID